MTRAAFAVTSGTRLVQVQVGIDQPGQDQAILRVELRAVGVDSGGDGDNPTGLDTDVDRSRADTR
jgi:hypothetical protein